MKTHNPIPKLPRTGWLFAALALVVSAGLCFVAWQRSLPAEWKALERYQETITHSEFETLANSVFTIGSTWPEFITITPTSAAIRVKNSVLSPHFTLRFSPVGSLPKSPPKSWRSTKQLPSSPSGKSLAGLKIAIDPGHIGGNWAIMEERWLSLNDGPPIMEGDMTLQVAFILKPLLESMGATVSLVRSTSDPVTSLRPASTDKADERRFYRTDEIHARAQLVNSILKPDLVLCLHFNAEPWGNPAQPTLTDRSHFHLILNGAYTAEELAQPDQRLAMLMKLLSRAHGEEVLVGSQLATTFSKITGLPPYQYPPDAENVRPIPGAPHLWARNLLANRLYDCPVIYLEPYVMNSTTDFPRLQAGDYPGIREINGKPQASIFQEYANSIAQGLADHYSKPRP